MSSQHTNMKDIFPDEPISNKSIQDHEDHKDHKDHEDHEDHMYRRNDATFMDNIYENKWIIILILILCIGLYVYFTPSLYEKVKGYYIPKPETPKYMEAKLQNLEL